MTKRLCSIDGCGRAHFGRGYCNRHWQSLRKAGKLPVLVRPTAEQRFWAKVNKDGPIPSYRPDLGACWLWTASPDSRGYGSFHSSDKTRRMRAYQFSWELHVGAVPAGLELDHLCRVRMCVNPHHLEPVTHAENVRRGIGSAPDWQKNKTHCPSGHAYADHAYSPPSRPTARYCGACNNERGRERRAKAREERQSYKALNQPVRVKRILEQVTAGAVT